MNDEKRTPEETEKMAREVMKRMLQTPPQTHDVMPKTRPKAKKLKPKK